MTYRLHTPAGIKSAASYSTIAEAYAQAPTTHLDFMFLIVDDNGATVAIIYQDQLWERVSPLAMTEGIRLLCDERVRQIEVAGMTTEKNMSLNKGELANAAAFMATQEGPDLYRGTGAEFLDWLKTKSGLTRIRQLAVAGAFAAAEIDRLLEEEKNRGRTSDGL